MKTIIITLLIFITIFAGTAKAQDASSEGSTVLQRVKEKVEALKKNPRAYFGTITDKTDTTIQLESAKGAVELISVTDVTHFSKLGKSETEIKFSDIAIGDYIFALGTFGNTEVLNARRVVLTSSPINKRTIVTGRVKSIAKRVLTLIAKDKEYVFSFPAKWKGPEIKVLKPEDQVVVISTIKDGKDTVRTIELVK